MRLKEYHKKRNFNKTPEPAGKRVRSFSNLSFVVQRHKASRLHYDFRLELNGVLKSWAVPKGPSMNPGDKRLAMMVEDHPYEYKDFKGVIPEGNYGAGLVEQWDHGKYSDIDNSPKKAAEKKLRAGLKSGNLKFSLYGKKLKGEFALVHTGGMGENAWLLIKHRDHYATDRKYNSEDYTAPGSPINNWLKERKDEKKSGSNKRVPVARSVRTRKLRSGSRKLSKFISPMLAKEIDEPFDDRDWLFELKWDGYRAIAEVNKKNVKLYSRNGNLFNDAYPEITEALSDMGIQAVLDGEIVVLTDKGIPSFQLLQNFDGNHPMVYYVFDLIQLGRKNLEKVSLRQRKKQLKALLKRNGIIRYSDHILKTGIRFFNVAGKKGLEGVMAKKADSLYHPGVRTGDWLKIKHHQTRDAVIAGFTRPGGTRKYFGALVLGAWSGKKLKYIGHTGTGFDAGLLRKLHAKLKTLIRSRSPFSEEVKTNNPVTWVKPQLVCELKFTEITSDGLLRHPVFLHLRDDVKPASVKWAEGRKLKTGRKKK